jgi:hypothetical protein
MPHKYWIRERGTDCYCPVEGSNIVTGMNFITTESHLPGICVGEFWYDKDLKIQVELKPEFAITATDERKLRSCRGGSTDRGIK